VMVTMLNGTLALLCTKQLCVKLRIDISAVTAVFLIPCCSGSGDLLGVRGSARGQRIWGCGVYFLVNRDTSRRPGTNHRTE